MKSARNVEDGSRSGDGPAAALETAAAGFSWAIPGTALDWSRMSERSHAAPAAAHIARLLTGGLLSVLGSSALR